jgi:hypothetical protein
MWWIFVKVWDFFLNSWSNGIKFPSQQILIVVTVYPWLDWHLGQFVVKVCLFTGVMNTTPVHFLKGSSNFVFFVKYYNRKVCKAVGVRISELGITVIEFLLMINLTHFSQCIYFMPLHVSSNKRSSSGGSDCVNTSFGIIHSSGWLSCVPVSLTGTQDSRPLECIIPDDILTQFDPPDDVHLLLETCRGVKQIHWEKCVKLVINKN